MSGDRVYHHKEHVRLVKQVVYTEAKLAYPPFVVFADCDDRLELECKPPLDTLSLISTQGCSHGK
jgi:hypothetical protein